MSAADFKHTMKSNDLYDCNIEQRTDVAVISIANSSEDSEPDDIFANGPSSRWFRQRHRNVLNLIFDDVSASGTEPLAGSSDGDGYVIFDERMACEIAAFVDANKDVAQGRAWNRRLDGLPGPAWGALGAVLASLGWPKEIYYRIFAAEYLPDTLDRVLYL